MTISPTADLIGVIPGPLRVRDVSEPLERSERVRDLSEPEPTTHHRESVDQPQSGPQGPQAQRGGPKMTTLVEHFETHLGRIISGWSVDEDGRDVPFQVILLPAGPIENANVLATLGLSNVPMRVHGSSRWLRQELMLMFRSSDGPQNLPVLLQQVALRALSQTTAYAIGEVVGPLGGLRHGSQLDAFVVAPPVYLPDSFHTFRGKPDPVVIGWLVPISAGEASVVRSKGYPALEEAFQRTDPDLLDFHRPTVA